MERDFSLNNSAWGQFCYSAAAAVRVKCKSAQGSRRQEAQKASDKTSSETFISSRNTLFELVTEAVSCRLASSLSEYISENK